MSARLRLMLTLTAAITASWIVWYPAAGSGICEDNGCLPGGPSCELTGCTVSEDVGIVSCFYNCEGSDGSGEIYETDPDGSNSECVYSCSGGGDDRNFTNVKDDGCPSGWERNEFGRCTGTDW